MQRPRHSVAASGCNEVEVIERGVAEWDAPAATTVAAIGIAQAARRDVTPSGPRERSVADVCSIATPRW